MRTEQKTSIQNSIGRLVISALSFVIQVLWLSFIGIKLKNYSVQINICTSVIALILAMWVFNRRDTNSNFKMPWIMLILAFPILGICLFVVFGHKYSKKARCKMDNIHIQCFEKLKLNGLCDADLSVIDKGITNQFRYLMNVEGFPLFQNSDVVFYGDASEAYDEIIREAEAAEKFIFLEYFAVQDKKAFARLHDVLLKKVQQGIEVRILYDDIGSVGFLNSHFAKKLEEEGIHCKTFNKVSPAFRLYMNNRDHRKIAVIDGRVAFTGGFNIADEYFNITHPYGIWKDTGVKITGKAVSSFLCMFLEMWNSMEKTIEDLSGFEQLEYPDARSNGFVLPYADSPLDNSRVGENVYLNMINNAKDSIFITTPYLVISDEMKRALQMAAGRGVDVRIVTPGIPDKIVVYQLTRSYYGELIRSGVKIYEYTPGFIHGKQVVVDGELAAVGTINLDYRSLFHHFEDAVLLYKVDAIKEITKDFEELFACSRRAGEEYEKEPTIGKRVSGAILRLIAPLM